MLETDFSEPKTHEFTGWSAHILEQNASNALIRPHSDYSGKAQRKVPAINKRK